MSQRALVAVALFVSILLLSPSSGSLGSVGTELISLDANGQQLDRMSRQALVSADGRYVAFESRTPDLSFSEGPHYCSPTYSEAGPPCTKLFMRDRTTMTTEELLVGIGGVRADAPVSILDMSPDARYLLIGSRASNIDPLDVPEPTAFFQSTDAFVYDRVLGAGEKVNIAPDGSQTAYESFVGQVSADGRFVAIRSELSLDPADTNSRWDTYLRDREADTTEWVTDRTDHIPAPHGATGGQLTDDGRYLIFRANVDEFGLSAAGALPQLVVLDLESRTFSTMPSAAPDTDLIEIIGGTVMSSDGRYLLFSARMKSGVSEAFRLYFYDRESETLEIAGVNPSGQPVQTVRSGQQVLLEPGGVSDDGRYFSFWSESDELAPPDNNNCIDVFVRDRTEAMTVRANVGITGAESRDDAALGLLSADGSTVVFASGARDLVQGDINGMSDIFAIAVSSLPGQVDPVAADSYCGIRPGDTDCDDQLTLVDVVQILRYVSQTSPYLECIHLANGMNCFSSYLPGDALQVLRHLLDPAVVVGCGAK